MLTKLESEYTKMSNNKHGFNVKQYVPNDHIMGLTLTSTIMGSKIIGYGLSGTLNEIQIELTDGKRIVMHGFFTDTRPY